MSKYNKDMPPGLYQNGVLVKSWKTLIEDGFLTVDCGALRSGYVSEEEFDANCEEDGIELTEADRDDLMGVDWDVNIYSDMLDGVLILPNDGSITELDECCFCAAANLIGVILPDSLKFIRRAAFASTAIEEMNVPSGVVSIDNNAFFNCKRLKYINLPKGLEEIGKTIGSIKDVEVYIDGQYLSNFECFNRAIKYLDEKDKPLDEMIDELGYTYKKINLFNNYKNVYVLEVEEI